MASDGGGETRSSIGGGTQHGPVLQGRDFSHLTFVTNQSAAAPVARAQLPAPVAGFTGRHGELAEFAGLLDPARGTGAVVVSAVAGLAGVGKTALAIQAGHAARASGWFPGGVLFIDLHGYDDALVRPQQALDSLLRALGVPAEHVPPGLEDRAGLYRSVLAQVADPVLVIADNASSEAQVRLLLPGPGPHRVIITSRHTLAGLGVRLLDVTVLDQPTAVRLLDEILRTARPDDDRIRADRVAAGELAGICGGLPLALRIAGALLAADPVLTAADLAGELRGEVGRLQALAYDDGGGTSAPSVAAAFELSYRQLDATAALLFRLLPVNPGPDFSTAAAAALAGLSAGETRRVIGRLVRAHLVEPASVAGRWRMHDLLGLYARELSDAEAEADEREQALDRLLGYYQTNTSAADDHLKILRGAKASAGVAGRDDALAWLDAERPNLVAAVVLAASTSRDQVALDLPLRLSEYLSWRRQFDDLIAILRISRDAAHRQSSRVNEGTALNNLGGALVQVRRFEEAIAACQDAAAIYRETCDRHGEGMALNNLGLALVEVRRFEEAIRAHQDAAVIYREAGDRHREGNALNNLGAALLEVRRFEEAIRAHQDAAVIYREAGDRHSEGMALGNLGLALRDVRRFDEAITACQDVVVIFREAGDRHREGMALTNLSVALVEVGRFDEAITACQDAVVIFREAGDRHSEGAALTNLSVALVEVGRFEEAIRAHQDAVVIYREAGDRHSEGMALTNLGVALQDVRRFDEAITACQDAVVIFREAGDRHSEGIALNNIKMARAAQET
jgi:tetratricopeptide (TPR) repeat protein